MDIQEEIRKRATKAIEHILDKHGTLRDKIAEAYIEGARDAIKIIKGEEVENDQEPK